VSLIETEPTPATRAHSDPSTVNISVDGHTTVANEGELVVEAILREKEIPHICYHSSLMGPIQTCDTCLVEVDGKLVRSCGTKVSSGMEVVTDSKRANDARAEAFDVILGNHMLYCTVCDNNNENCRVHNTALELNVQHQEHPFKPKPYEIDMSNPFYRYDPSQCILADSVSRPARQWRSMRRFPLAGNWSIRGYFGMVACRSADQAVSLAAIASRFAPATR
jgi:formate dehydrogenase major subunit